MTARTEQIEQFLLGTPFGQAKIAPLAGDASARKYFRLHKDDGRTAVVMDDPPADGNDISNFMRVAQWLAGKGLSAPEILEADEASGLLLLEDLGDNLFSRVVERDPAKEAELYEAAVNVSLELTHSELPGVEVLDPITMGPLVAPVGEWFAGDTKLASDISAACTEVLKALPDVQRCVLLRDFHAENLLWLPNRQGVKRVGLLDFQDARNGHPTYDLASLLRDARRDVDPDLQRSLIKQFARGIGWTPEETYAAVCAQAAQRNLRILGVFARLSLHFGKPQYVDLIPRVWKNLMEELAHPDLKRLREVAIRLPEPTPEKLKNLRDRCGTIHTLA